MEIGFSLSPVSSAINAAFPRAALGLDFLLGETLDSRITFTRPDAATCATSFGSDGRLVTVAANIPRFDYDPSQANGTTGPELVSNGDFSNGTSGWSLTDAVVTDGTLVCGYGVSTLYNQQTVPVTQGKTYQITFTISALNGIGGSGVSFTASGGTFVGVHRTTTGTFSENIVASSSSLISLGIRARGSGINSAVIDNISVKEVQFQPRGLLIEESRTNLLLHSRNMTQAAWSKTDVTAARTQIGLDGVANTACLMTEGSAGTAISSQIGSAVTAGSTITGSVVLKRGNTDWIRVFVTGGGFTDGAHTWFNLNTGAKGSTTVSGAGTGISSTIQSLGGGWYRCTATVTPNGVFTAPYLSIMSAAADNSTTRVANATYIVDCAQLEVGAFATSIIITDASTKTRAADSASMTGTNFSSWFSASAGTFVAEASAIIAGSGNNQQVININNNSSTDCRALRIRSNNLDMIYMDRVGGVSNDLASFVLSNGVVFKASFAYSSAGNSFTVNGLAVLTNAAAAPANPDRLGIGNTAESTSASFLNGHIRRIAFYPTRLPNATLQALTA